VGSADVPPPVAELEQAVREYLEEPLEALEREEGIHATMSTDFRLSADGILTEAAVHDVSLIVMSTHGRSGVGRLICGSVAESVLRGTTIPIFLRRPPEAPVELPSIAAPPLEVLR